MPTLGPGLRFLQVHQGIDTTYAAKEALVSELIPLSLRKIADSPQGPPASWPHHLALYVAALEICIFHQAGLYGFPGFT